MSTHSEIEVPYRPVIYNQKIKHIEGAKVEMRARNINLIFSGPIPDCFLKHNVHSMFAACLIHRHFELDDDERNVGNDGKAAPSKSLDGIHASSWIVSDETLYPDEFHRSSTPTPSEAFPYEYRQTLEQYQLSVLLGSRLTPMAWLDRRALIPTTVVQRVCLILSIRKLRDLIFKRHGCS